MMNDTPVLPKPWKEFKESGLLWFINTILHAFGWAIVIQYDDNSEISDVYPARVNFRGFSENINTKGYRNLSKYIKENSNKLYEESLED